MVGFIFVYWFFAGLDGFIVAYAISFSIYYITHDLYKGEDNWFINSFKIFIRGFTIIVLICLAIGLMVYFNLLDINVYASSLEDMNIGANTVDNSANTNKDSYKLKIEMEVDKKVADGVGSSAQELLVKALEGSFGKMASNAGAGAAAGAVGSAVIKSKLPPVAKLVMLGGATIVTAGSVKIGTAIGEAIVENRRVTTAELYKNDPDRIPSPDKTFISSLLDKGEISSPLQDLLNAQFYINILLFVLIFLFIFVLFNKLFSNYTSSWIIRTMSNKTIDTNKAKRFFNFTAQLSLKYFYFIFIILTLNIFLLLFLSFTINIELMEHLDDYIRVHNDIYKNSLIGASLKCSGVFNKQKLTKPQSMV